VEGARAARRGLLEAYPTADFRAAVVFIDMLDGDNARAAASAGRRIAERRVTAFHDPARRAGRLLARTLGWRHHVAWDCYLFYPAGTRWDGPRMPPAPRWFHQLRNREVWEAERSGPTNTRWTHQIPEQSEAPPHRFRTGGGLAVALREAAGDLLTRAPR
jgi:hypothetical protein